MCQHNNTSNKYRHTGKRHFVNVFRISDTNSLPVIIVILCMLLTFCMFFLCYLVSNCFVHNIRGIVALYCRNYCSVNVLSQLHGDFQIYCDILIRRSSSAEVLTAGKIYTSPKSYQYQVGNWTKTKDCICDCQCSLPAQVPPTFDREV